MNDLPSHNSRKTITTFKKIGLNIGLHAQTLERADGIIAGSEVTTFGLKKAFEKRNDVNRVSRYGPGNYTSLDTDDLDLLVVEGWDTTLPKFIQKVKKHHPMEKKDKVIFTFWEPRRNIIPYIELCMKTWEKNLPDYEVVVLNYSNLCTYINKDTYDISLLKKLRLPIQKDAVMVAVLKEHGGIFMDADTLVLKDITPIVNKLYNTEVILFNTHLAFVAAHSNSLILTLWLRRIQEKLRKSLENPNAQDERRWDFLGNSVLPVVMEEIISSSLSEKNILTELLDKGVNTCMNLEKKNIMQNQKLSNKLTRVKNFLLWRRKKLYYQTTLKKYLTMLNRNKYGFMPEVKYKKNKGMNAIDRQKKHYLNYVNFWFNNNLNLDNVFLENQIIIGLHNSWTPEWYKELSEKEVLENSCLLSRTIKQILSN